MEQDLYGLQASGIDPEIAAQMLGLKRKRSVADALMQQALSPLKADRVAPGGLAVPISPWEGIAQLAKAYMGSKGLEDLDKQQGDLTRQNQAKVTEAISGYMQRRDGTPETQMTTAVDDEGNTNPMVAGRAPDMKEAIKFGLTNNLLQNSPLVKMDAAAFAESQKPRVLGRTLVTGDGKTLATDSTWAEEQRTAQEARAAQNKAALEAKAAEAAAQRQSREDMVRLAASLRQPAPPSFAEVLDPKDPSRLLKIDGKLYKGGSLGDAGVIGIAGKEPTAAKKAEQVDEGRNNVASVVSDLRGYYKNLKENNGIVDSENGAASNAIAALSSSGLGQAFGHVVGSENQKNRDSISQARPLLMQAVMKASGMNAKQMDSNAELKMWIATATDPKLDRSANEDALNRLDKMYGLGLGSSKPNEAAGSITKRVSSEADYNALPSGSTYIDPQGRTRTKR